jgi:hypothetical protein
MKGQKRARLLDGVRESKLVLCKEFFDEDVAEYYEERVALAMKFSESDYEDLAEFLGKQKRKDLWMEVYVNNVIDTSECPNGDEVCATYVERDRYERGDTMLFYLPNGTIKRCDYCNEESIDLKPDQAFIDLATALKKHRQSSTLSLLLV